MNGAGQTAVRSVRLWLACALVALVALRVSIALGLSLPVESDGEAYLLMAEAMANGWSPTDQHGQIAFYSIGYPLVLVPFVALFGASIGTVVFANAVLTALSGVFVFSLARSLGFKPGFAVLAVMLFACWIPGAWNGAQAAKENLSTPLLLLLLWASVRIAQGGGRHWLVAAGSAYGFGLLTGGSTLLLALVPLGALVFDRGRGRGNKVHSVAVVAASAAACVLPWLIATTMMLGTPVLNTNGGFNLYLGNNPAATGRFVSIHETPAGPDWSDLRKNLGEVGASNELANRAKAHILEHPLDTARLGAKKLALFWAPNLPDAEDFAQSPLVAQLRIIEVAQYLLLLVCGLAGLAFAMRDRTAAVLCAATIGLFWGLHAVAYIIPRYRDPVMPVLLIGAVALLAMAFEKYRQRKPLHVS